MTEEGKIAHARAYRSTAGAVVIQAVASDRSPLAGVVDCYPCQRRREEVITLVALVKALLNHTYNPDLRELAVYQATGLMEGILPADEAEELVRETVALVRRSPSPLDSMF